MSKIEISVVIPYYEVDEEKREVLRKCTNSLKGHDEIIVVWNDKMGYSPAINRGALCANGDFIVIMNDDVELVQGDLSMLCREGVVTSPTHNGREYPFIWGSCFCVPKAIWKKVGGMDERYTTSYFDDDDLIAELAQENISMESVSEVVFDHREPGRTLEQLPDRDEFFKENEKRFIDKWGYEPSMLMAFYNTYGRLPKKGEI